MIEPLYRRHVSKGGRVTYQLIDPAELERMAALELGRQIESEDATVKAAALALITSAVATARAAAA